MSAHLAYPTTTPPLGEPDFRVSEAVYWEKYYERSDVHYEWNNGYLEEKPVSDHLTYQVYAWFVALLKHFLDTDPIAGTTGLEMGFRLTLPGKVVIRKPDLAVVCNDNTVPLRPLDRSYRGVFDLCVEALSDSTEGERQRDEVGKKGEYAAGGVPEYYILHHDADRLAFYRLTRRGIYRPIPSGDGIVRSRILPGFRFRKDDLLRRTAMETLRHDPVYREFLLPGWQRAEQERDHEADKRREAEQARDRAEQERNHEADKRREAEQVRDEMQRARLEAIANLHAMGLDHERIARTLGLDGDLVAQVLAANSRSVDAPSTGSR